MARRSETVGWLAAAHKPDEGFAFKLAAEQGANPRAGEPKRMAGAVVERQDEGVAEHLADGARLDLGALRRRTACRAARPNTHRVRGSLRVSWTPASCRLVPAAAHLSRIGTALAANGFLCGVGSRRRAGRRCAARDGAAYAQLNLTKR